MVLFVYAGVTTHRDVLTFREIAMHEQVLRGPAFAIGLGVIEHTAGQTVLQGVAPSGSEPSPQHVRIAV